MVTDLQPSSSSPSSSSPKSKISATNRLLSLFKSKPGCFRRYKSFFQELQGPYGYLFEHLSDRFMPRRNFNEVAQCLQEIMMDSLPKLEYEDLRTEISSQINDAIANHIPLHVDSLVRSYLSGHILHVHPTKDTPNSVQEQQYQLYLTIKDNPQLQKDDVSIWLALKIKFERLQVATTPCRPSVIRPRDQDDPHDDAHSEGENITKRKKTSEHGTFVFGESLSNQDYENKPGPSTSGNHNQSDDFDFWTNSYATNDDVLPNEKVSQKLMDEMSQTVNEAKLRKVVNEMLRQQCTLGDEHQYHIDQMQNFLKSDIVWEKIVARRANGCIVSITYSDYKNLNKNDIEDMYLLIINHKVDDYAKTGLLWSLSIFIRSTVIWERVHDFQLGVESYQHQVNLTAPTITFPGIEKYKVFIIVSEPVYDIIYKNNKKEKRVMRHQEVHKFCNATLKRIMEGSTSYNKDVKYGYVTHNLGKEDVEYLQLFAEDIEERLKYRDQMRRWEMYMNGRPLRLKRERLE
nr:hypothetical protein [Tanacetum cinerariifolium]